MSAPTSSGAHPRRRREIVLVGGGHAHVQVLRRLAMQPPPRARLTVVVDVPLSVYSGMVPGFVAGQYRAGELEIDVRPLARRAGARIILGRAVGVDPRGRRIEVEGRAPVPYDLASFDVGSTVAGLELPGVREHAIPTRPIGRYVHRIDEIVARVEAVAAASVVVVGGGAGGVELAFCLERRLRAAAGAARMTLVHNRGRVLQGYPESLVRRVHRHADRRGIEILLDRRVEAAEAGAVLLDGGDRLACDAVVWVTGAVSQPLFRRSGLPTDERGFVQVRSTLQVPGFDDLLAVGDCATLMEHPRTPKAGVYAVRQGPYLTDNLLAALGGAPLRRYRPQSDFLTLLNLGDGAALGAKWGRSFEGRWVMRLKDRIDRRFMRRFQVLDREGGLLPEFARTPETDNEMERPCGGCAAKVGRSVLDRALARLGPGLDDGTVRLGLARPDDAAAYSVDAERLVVTSIDAFRAFTDDPWLVGRVAAVNALSDLHAKAVTPRYALALVAVPGDEGDEAREEILYQVLAGARAALDAEGVTLIGGHSLTASELLVGFGVDATAAAGAPLLTLDGLREGDALVLTKPLGTGVLLHADLRGRARGPWIEAAVASMLRGNGEAAAIAVACGAGAATDVTGFGLAGHLGAMLRASGLSAVVDLSALPALPGALELLRRGLRSTSHPDNAAARHTLTPAAPGQAGRDEPDLELLFDPQTSGGLLFGVRPERAPEAVARLERAGEPAAAIIGHTAAPRGDGALIAITRRADPRSSPLVSTIPS